jgi:hypothetical protein
MVDVSRIIQGDPPKGGSGTAPPKPKEPEVWVEPWKPWAGYFNSDYTAWYEWMRSNKSFAPDNLKAGEALRLYQIMNDIVYEIKRKNDEGKS